MIHPVRVPGHVDADIDRQLPPDRAEVFRAHDLAEAIEALRIVDWWLLPELPSSPGVRRFTVDAARTVAGYHMAVGLDPWADDAGGLVVHAVDIWPDRWPGR